MPQKRSSNFFSDIPPTLKGIITILVLGGGGYLLTRTIKKGILIQDSKSQVNEEIKELKEQTQKPTLTKSQAQTYSNSLFSAMDGYGTDFSLIRDIFSRINNYADFLLISTTFGIRTISSGAYNPAPNFVGTLTQCLADELSSNERKQINTILSKKGIPIAV